MEGRGSGAFGMDTDASTTVMWFPAIAPVRVLSLVNSAAWLPFSRVVAPPLQAAQAAHRTPLILLLYDYAKANTQGHAKKPPGRGTTTI